MLGLSRRGVAPGPPLSLPSTLDDSTAGWKGGPAGGGPDNQSVPGGGGSGPGNGPGNGPGGGGGNPGLVNNNFGPSGPNSFGGGNPNSNSNNVGGPGSVFPQNSQGSPAGNNQGGGYPSGPPPGSNTPQYTASPAPSGSSTPGPGPPQNVSGAGFPPPPNSAGPPGYNGPGPGPGGPFGSPSGGGPPFGRPGSSGPAFAGGPGGPHFASPGPGGFGGPQFGMPPGSPFGHGPGGHPMGPMGPGHMMGGPQPVDRMDQGPRRHTSYFSQTEHRVFELNKRLQQRTEESDNCWWDSFATEFFEDDATLTISFCLEDGPKRYTIGRTLIPRYFRSIYEGGVSELYFHLKHSKESFHNTSITLDCDQCTVVTHHGKQMFTKIHTPYFQVCAEARLVLEFMYDDYMRIKTWHMAVKNHRELIPRSVLAMHSHPSQSDPSLLEQMTKNVTRSGITNSTLNYLRLCVILEPMQELMSRHKAYALSPRDCLKTTLFQKWQRMVAPPDAQRPANKRRKRKGSASGGNANAPPVPSKKRSPGPNFSLASQDVMVVGEPSLMGGEFGDEDERLITRLENTQYDAANSIDHDGGPVGPGNHGGFVGHGGDNSPMTGGPNSWNMDRGPMGPGGPGGPGPGGGVPGGGQQINTPSNQDTDKKSPAVSQ